VFVQYIIGGGISRRVLGKGRTRYRDGAGYTGKAFGGRKKRSFLYAKILPVRPDGPYILSYSPGAFFSEGV